MVFKDGIILWWGEFMHSELFNEILIIINLIYNIKFAVTQFKIRLLGKK